MISKFFIDRPVFSMVLSILITLAGVVSIASLPIAQFPEIVPPVVQITASYPGANAQTVSQSVAAPIEQQLSGARNLLYYQSLASNDGNLTINATFEIGSDQDLAAVEVQNRLAIAQPRLPQEVVRQGISVKKTSTSMLCVIALKSDDALYDDVYLSNYATINLLDAAKRVPGVGDAIVFGSKDYSMRVWLDPDRLAQKQMTVSDVTSAVREQNAIFAAGRIGQRPTPNGTELTIPVLTKGRLSEPSEYENIILRANPDGSIIRLGDVARIELGSLSYDLFGRLSGKPTTLLIVYLQTGANAINVFEGVKRVMEEASASFPTGIGYSIPYETVSFVKISIEEVVHTLLEAVVLVLAVVFIFLQNFRATLIPLLAVPVSIVGAFAGMLALGFSINTLTLFGLVLAIGIVVDDAIVVVENVERIMHDEKLPVREATIKAMNEVTGPVIAIVLVLSAVFVPVAFMGGLTGELYRQFAITIAVSVIISGIVALTLSPALCRLLLKPGHGKKFVLFRAFDWGFERLTRGYTFAVRLTVKLAIVTILIFAGLLYVNWDLIQRVPSGFLPDEDQGYIICAMVLPDGASLDRTDEVASRVEEFFIKQPEVADTVLLGGLDLLGGSINATNSAIMFIPLKPWDERKGPGQSAQAIIGRAWRELAPTINEGLVLSFNPPSIQGLGQRAGFEMQLQARGGGDVIELGKVLNDFMRKAGEQPEITGLNAVVRTNLPQLYVELDRTKTKMMGVPITTVFESLQAYMGSLYVNDFDKFGRVWRVQMQAEPQFRRDPGDLRRVYVRNETGDMVPLASVVSTRYQAGPNLVSRFNGYLSVQITGAPAPGFGSGDAIKAVERAAKDSLPPGYGFEWSGATFQEIRAGSQAPIVLGFGLIVVFLVLAAQYEKWTLPFAVMLAVPLGVLGAYAAVFWRGFPADIYFQIGLLTLVGLSAKNAILIVEFCSALRKQGKGLVESAVEAARLRFRPILMTSLAFILGVLPLAIATGAGANGRQSIGTGVMGGMLAATFLAIFFVPLFFVLVQGFGEMIGGRRSPGESERTPAPPSAHADHAS